MYLCKCSVPAQSMMAASKPVFVVLANSLALSSKHGHSRLQHSGGGVMIVLLCHTKLLCMWSLPPYILQTPSPVCHLHVMPTLNCD